MKREVAVLAMAMAAMANDGMPTAAEREFLVETLEGSRDGVLRALDGITEAQWNFKPQGDRWSVRECLEHLILTEDFIFGISRKLLQAPAGARLATGTAENDRRLLAAMSDRSTRAQAPEPVRPTGQWTNLTDARAEFIKRRDRGIAFARNTSEALRLHVGDSPFGKVDSYQWLLLMAGHTVRHTAQIKEVQADAGYPAASPRGRP